MRLWELQWRQPQRALKPIRSSAETRRSSLVPGAAPSPIERLSMDPKVVITIFLCGDVMIGRGTDQILPHPGDPTLHETYVRSAETHVQLAEEKNGPIKRPADFGYTWGDALAQLERVRPSLRLVNLETSVTTSRAYWEGKEVHYRVHPQNISCLRRAGIGCCVVANNHVLDYGYAGLAETRKALEDARIKPVGAGRDASQAATPVRPRRQPCLTSRGRGGSLSSPSASRPAVYLTSGPRRRRSPVSISGPISPIVRNSRLANRSGAMPAEAIS